VIDLLVLRGHTDGSKDVEIVFRIDGATIIRTPPYTPVATAYAERCGSAPCAANSVTATKVRC
jgi:hypothetical protein